MDPSRPARDPGPRPDGQPIELPTELVAPHPSRLDPTRRDFDQISARHEAALAAGQPIYIDPATGLWVMTAATLWEKPCCDRGCRHCPHVERRN